VLLEILHFRKWMQHDKGHERHLLLTYHQLIPPFSSKPQVSLSFFITFVFRIIVCVNPSFQEQSVCMTRNHAHENIISNVSAMNTTYI
jgi:hypothetical protein